MEWQKISETSQKIGYKTIVDKSYRLPDGQEGVYTTWGKPGANNAAVIALTPDSKVVIARQFRPGPEKIFEELPGGGVEQDEEPIVAAARELLEETGYASDEPLESLGVAYRDAYANETNHYYIARNCRQVNPEQSLDEGELVEICLIDIKQLLTNAKEGRMSDGIGVLMAYDILMQLQGEQTHAESN
jgi:ADP-ribose pyrophosphatase